MVSENKILFTFICKVRSFTPEIRESKEFKELRKALVQFKIFDKFVKISNIAT